MSYVWKSTSPPTAPRVCLEHSMPVLTSCSWNPQVGHKGNFMGHTRKRKSQSALQVIKLGMKLLFVSFRWVHLYPLGTHVNLRWVRAKA